MEKDNIKNEKVLLWILFSIIFPMLPIGLVLLYDFIVGYPLEFDNLVSDYLMAVVAVVAGTINEIISIEKNRRPLCRKIITVGLLLLIVVIYWFHGRLYEPEVVASMPNSSITFIYKIGMVLIVIMALVVIKAHRSE